MKALLVYPAMPDTFWNTKHLLKLVRKRAAHVPPGVLTVASLLPQDWDVQAIDMNVQIDQFK